MNFIVYVSILVGIVTSQLPAGESWTLNRPKVEWGATSWHHACWNCTGSNGTYLHRTDESILDEICLSHTDLIRITKYEDLVQDPLQISTFVCPKERTLMCGHSYVDIPYLLSDIDCDKAPGLPHVLLTLHFRGTDSRIALRKIRDEKRRDKAFHIEEADSTWSWPTGLFYGF